MSRRAAPRDGAPARRIRSKSQHRARGKRGKGRAARGRGKFARAIFVGGLCLLAALCALFFWSILPGAVPGETTAAIHFEVRSKEKGEVIEHLAESGLLTAPLLTKLYALLLTPTVSFEPRSHLLSPGMSARELVQRLAELGSRPRAKVIFPEGWTHLAMGAQLEKSQICSSLGFRTAVHDDTLLRELGLSGSAEGYLFPASYQFLVDSDPRHIVRRLVTEARKRLASLKQLRPPHPDLKRLGFGDAEIFTLASIVEKESRTVDEAPRVARVFINRLLEPEAETRGRLQSDPTAAYGCLLNPFGPPSCARYRKLVTPEMLDDAENPYNTYRNAGLPPGPISNPGERALSAVLSPADGRQLYFVSDGTGTHTFSETYSQHLKAVETLRARKKLNKGE